MWWMCRERLVIMPKFSIVTSSYNSWGFMENYWKSLEEQTYQDFEIIIVDDCSKDGTFAKICEYASNSSLNIKVLQNVENCGPGFTRNRGIDKASGEWITFVDSDDSIDIHLLEKVEQIINANQRTCALISCIVYDYNIVKGMKNIPTKSIYGDNRGGVQSTSTCIARVRNHTFGKFFELKRIKEKRIKFPELKRCEDVAFICRAIDACCMDGDTEIGHIYYLKEPLYNYYQRPDSVSNNTSLDATDMVKAYQIINETLGIKYPNEICIKAIPDLLYGGILMMCKADKGNREIKSYINDFEKRYPYWYKNQIVKELGMTKWIFLMCIKHRNLMFLKILTKLHTRMVG